MKGVRATRCEEVGDPADRLLEHVDVREGDQPEVIRLGPVEAGAVGDQDLLGTQQLDHEHLVVLDRVDLGVEAREAVERPVRLHRGHSRDLVEQSVGEHALLVEPPAGHDQLLDRLVAAECGLDRVLGRHVGAHAHVGDQGEALEEVGRDLLGPGDHHPAGAVATDPVGLGKSAEGQAEHVVAGGLRGMVMHRIVEQDLLVDLVSEHHEIVASGDVDHALDDRLAVDRAGRVVGVDDHQGVGVLGDLRLDVGEVGIPVVGLVAQVVHGLPTAQRDGAGPQRIVGCRHQDLVAIVDECLQDKGNQLGDAVADEDVVDVDFAQALLLVVLRNSGARGVDALRVAVTLRLGQVVGDVGQDRLGGLEAERRRVADVELQDPVAFCLEPLRFDQDRTTNVVTDVVELAALSDLAHRTMFSGRRPESTLVPCRAGSAG